MVSALLASAAFPTGVGAASASVVVERDHPVQIAVVVPAGGPGDIFSPGIVNAVKLAAEKHGKIRGFPIQLNIIPDACPFNSLGAAASVVANPQNVAVIGHFCSSGYRMALSAVYEPARIVTISGSATSPLLPSFGPHVFNSAVVSDSDFETWSTQVEALPSDIFFRQDRYVKAYGSDAPPWADFYYDAASLLFEQVDDTSTLDGGELVIDRTALAAAVRATDGFKGVTCSVTIGSDGVRVDDPGTLAKCASTGFGH